MYARRWRRFGYVWSMAPTLPYERYFSPWVEVPHAAAVPQDAAVPQEAAVPHDAAVPQEAAVPHAAALAQTSVMPLGPGTSTVPPQATTSLQVGPLNQINAGF